MRLLLIGAGCALAVLASLVMWWASNRSALWNMAFAVVSFFVLLLLLLATAFLLTQAALP